MTVSIFDMADSWDDASTVFDAIKIDVTDTNSDSESRLLSLDVNGSTRFRVRKDGLAYASKGIQFYGPGEPRLENQGNNGIQFIRYSRRLTMRTDGIWFEGPGGVSGIQLASRCNNIWFPDYNTLEIKNDAIPQAVKIFNSYIDSSNYELLEMGWQELTNTFCIGTDSSGTGSTRSILFKFGPTVTATISSSNFIVHKDLICESDGGSSLGTALRPWGDLFILPSQSVTPSTNGGLAIEATNDTTLTFKLRGSDGVVRSGTIALS